MVLRYSLGLNNIPLGKQREKEVHDQFIHHKKGFVLKSDVFTCSLTRLFFMSLFFVVFVSRNTYDIGCFLIITLRVIYSLA